MTTPHPDAVTLNDFADDALPQTVRTDVSAHLVSCGECQTTVASLRQIRSAARQLTPLVPRPQAWAGIERELRAKGAVRRVPRWSWLAAAAAALMLVTFGGLKLADIRRHQADQARATADAPTAQSIEAELLQAEQHYQKAITGLEQIANAEKGSLDPQTAATLEKSLAVVDRAISESRAALKSQPDSEPAQASLFDNFKTKMSLLQDTVALINEMRKGNDAGAARIVTGLKQKDS